MTLVSEDKAKIDLICLRCGNEWEYTGVSTRAVCKRCNYRFIINSKEKHYIRIDLDKHGQGIVNAMKTGKRFAILDCEGSEVKDISIIE